jgi:uracil-DNA glycosylase
MSKRDQLDAIRQRILDEMVCPLKDAATNLVFGKGNPDAQHILSIPLSGI